MSSLPLAGGIFYQTSNMRKEQISFGYEVYDSAEELTEQDKALVEQAREVTAKAYAPYSKFHVGAVALLSNGETVAGTNQENASYPVGICAERALLASASMLQTNVPINSMAISYHNMQGDSSKPISPCGMCRQALREYEQRTGQPIRILLTGMQGSVLVIEQAGQLLPFSFGSDDMK